MSSTPPSNFKVKLGWFNCTPIVLNYTATIFNRANWGDNSPLHWDFEWRNNCASIVLNCAGPILKQRDDFRSLAFSPHSEFRDKNGLNLLGFECAQLCSKHFRSYSPSLRDLSTFFQFARMRSMTQLRRQIEVSTSDLSWLDTEIRDRGQHLPAL